jgi:hypothetical protein
MIQLKTRLEQSAAVERAVVVVNVVVFRDRDIGRGSHEQRGRSRRFQLALKTERTRRAAGSASLMDKPRIRSRTR